jgi:hypothetical protein
MNSALVVYRRSCNPFGQAFADFSGGDGSAGFRVSNAPVNGGERLVVFLFEDTRRTLDF